MTKPYIHNEIDYKKILADYLVALIPLIIYGFYKNGIILYQNNLIGIFTLFKPLLMPFLGGIIGYAFNRYFTKEKSFSFMALYGVICGMIVSINLNLFAFIIICAIIFSLNYLLNKPINYNLICLIKIATIIALIVFQNYHYQNILELNNNYSYNYFNLFFGKGIAGVGISCTFLSVLAYFYLAFNPYYKKDIPLIILSAYTICSLIFGFITHNFSGFLLELTSGTLIFACVFIATNMVNSPYTKYGKIIYSIAIGCLAFGFSKLINLHEGIYIAIFLVSFLVNYLDNLVIAKIRH